MGDSRVNAPEKVHIMSGITKQAIDLLKVAEDLAQPDNIERYPGAIASVIRTARTLAEKVMDALTAYFAAQGGAE